MPDKTTEGHKVRRFRIVKGQATTITKRHRQRTAQRKERDKLKKIYTLDLDEVDRKILQLKMQFPSISQRELGIIVGLSMDAIGNRVRHERFQKAIREEQWSALEEIRNNQLHAAKKLRDLIDDADSRVAVRAALAHVWPLIRGPMSEGAGDEDFVKVVTDAYRLAQEERKASGR